MVFEFIPNAFGFPPECAFRFSGIPTKRVVPAFATEAEETDSLYKNRNVDDKQLLAAVKSGEAQVLTKANRWPGSR